MHDDDYYPNDEDVVQNKIKIVCPANIKRMLSQSDATVYKPAIKVNDIRYFAGQEELFFKPDVVDVDEGSEFLYVPDRPIVVWLKSTGKGKIVDMKKDILDGVTYYKVVSDKIENLQLNMSAEIFKKIRYTRFENCKITTDAKGLDKDSGKGIILLMQINYVLIGC